MLSACTTGEVTALSTGVVKTVETTGVATLLVITPTGLVAPPIGRDGSSSRCSIDLGWSRGCSSEPRVVERAILEQPHAGLATQSCDAATASGRRRPRE